MRIIKNLLIALALLAPVAAQAQYSQGHWVTHARYVMGNAQNIIDTGDKVYYLVSNNLYCFTKSTSSQQVLNTSSGLSGSLVSGIYYNSNNSKLAIVYGDYNIDFLDADGTVTNFPHFKDAVISRTRNINDITFADGKTYIASDFGYVILDDATMSVITSRPTNPLVTSAAVVGDRLVVSCTNSRFFHCDKNSVPESLASFTNSGGASGRIIPIDDTHFFLATSNKLYRYTMSSSNGTYSFTGTELVSAAPTTVTRTPTGFIANFLAASYYYTFDADGNNGTRVNGGQALFASDPNGDGTLWSITSSGLHNSTNPSTYYLPNAYDVRGYPYWLTYNPWTNKTYLTPTTDHSILNNVYSTARFDINSFDGSKWENINPTGTVGNQGWYQAVFVPGDSTGTYFNTGRTSQGIFKVQDKKVVCVYNSNNSPLVGRRASLRFDSKGNLWAVQSSLNNTEPVKVLPANKVAQNTVSNSDWTVYQVPNVTDMNSFKYMEFEITKSDVKVFTCGDWQAPIICWKNGDELNGEFESKSIYGVATDQGKSFEWTYIYGMGVDREEGIMVGTSNGVAFFKANEAWDDNFTAIVPEEFDGMQVLSFAADTANRKWVGTNGSGLYLMSADFKTVLAHYTADDSGLPSDVIYGLSVNTNDNSVMVVTPTGVVQYFPEFQSGASDYSNITVSPNPMRPDYNGFITIRGLMANSIVLIKDAAGNTVKQLQSHGEVAAWDACDTDGNRMPTAKYFIYAAQSLDDMPAEPQASVMVIK